MINQSEFLLKYKISGDDFEKSGLSWKDLKVIYDDHCKNIGLLETTGNYISERLRKASGVHSVRQRIKDPEHLIDKIIRKRIENNERDINIENYKVEITDLIGIRALHLFKSEWLSIHDFVVNTWTLNEKPTANLREGDPQEVIDIYEDKECNIKKHPYGYRSVHYLVKSRPAKEEFISEVQIRTIFEEGWSEIDHQIRYPHHNDDRLLSQFLVVFNRLAGSADEMGSYIQFLRRSLEEKDILHQNKIDDKAAIIEKLKKEINDLQIDASKKHGLQLDIAAISPSLISIGEVSKVQHTPSKSEQQGDALNAYWSDNDALRMKGSIGATIRFKKELKSNGYIKLEGFREDGQGFDGDKSELTPGNILSVNVADVGTREGVLAVFDSNGMPVGMLINSLMVGNYDDFMISIVRVLKKQGFKIEIVSVNKPIKKSWRQYFKCRTCD